MPRVGYDPAVENPKWNNLLAGAGSGFATRFLCQPLDVVKIRFQLQIEPIRRTSPSKYTNMKQAFLCIFREEKLFGFWKGHVPSQALSITYSMIQFTAFELFTKKLYQASDVSKHHQAISHFLSGALSGCCGTLFSHPFDVIRTRLVAQSEPKTYHSTHSAIKSILKSEGPRGLYRGFAPTILQIAPYAGSQFAFYKMTNNVWTFTFGSSAPSFERSLCCGAVSGIAAKTLVYPLDLVKKRLQIQGFHHARRCFGVNREYTGVWDCIVKVVQEERFLSLYKGLTPSVWKAAFTTALNFAFYEKIIRLLS